MANKVTKLDTDVAIIGGGPGGCTLAKELSSKGKKVVLLEKGGDDKRFLGSVLGNFLRLEKSINLPVPLKQTQEGDTVILANCLGGGTLFYTGAAAEPDKEYWKRHGIEIDQKLIDEARDECWVTLPPDEFIGAGAKRIHEAANDIGIPFEKQGRHVDFSKCKKGCEVCVNGCRHDAKWTAKEFASEAIKNGATVLCNTEAKEIIIEDGVAGGVRAKNNGTEYEVNGKVRVKLDRMPEPLIKCFCPGAPCLGIRGRLILRSGCKTEDAYDIVRCHFEYFDTNTATKHLNWTKNIVRFFSEGCHCGTTYQVGAIVHMG